MQQAIQEHFGVPNPVDDVRAAIRSLRKVPNLSIPGKALVQTTDVEGSIVWSDMLASDTDALFVPHTTNSRSEFKVNSAHPYAPWFTDFDNKVLALRARGHDVAAAFPKTLDNMVRRVFMRAAGNIFTLIKPVSGQAIYNMLFNVATLRLAYIHGDIIQEILGALGDHASEVQRAQAAIARVEQENAEDLKALTQQRSSDLKMQSANMGLEVVEAQGVIDQLSADQKQTQQQVLASASQAKLLQKQVQSAADDLQQKDVQSRGLSTKAIEAAEKLQTLQGDSQEARQKASSMLSQMRAEDQALRQDTATAQDRAAAAQAQGNRLQQLLQSKQQLLHQALTLQKTTAATVTSNKGTVASTQAELDAVLDQISQVTDAIKSTEERARSLQDKGTQVSADNAQSEAARDTRMKVQQDLAAAMDANKEMQAKHALWDSFAGLVDVQSKLNTYNDGLPR